MKKKYIYDACALMAYFQAEAGASSIEKLLYQAKKKEISIYLSLMQWGEILYLVERSFGKNEKEKMKETLYALPIILSPVTSDSIAQASHYKSIGGLSYADCFVLALAKTHNGIIVTKDPEFKKFADDFEIWCF